MRGISRPGMSGLAACVLGFLASGCATTDFVTGQPTRNMYSMQEDIALGTTAYLETIAQLQQEGYTISTDRERIEQVERIMRTITAHSHLPDLSYEVTLIEADDIVNAFAFPGGKFMVFSGLWHPEDGIVRDEDELAAIIAHEIAHVTCRHSTEEMTRHLPIQLLLMAGMLYAEAQEDEDIASVLALSFMMYNGLWVTRYSRQNELEADRVGMMYMAKAGYDPAAAARLWKRVHEHEGDNPAFMSIFSTHPRSELRYNELLGNIAHAAELYAASSKKPVAQQLAGSNDRPAPPPGRPPPKVAQPAALPPPPRPPPGTRRPPPPQTRTPRTVAPDTGPGVFGSVKEDMDAQPVRNVR